jgi:predicted membrane protein
MKAIVTTTVTILLNILCSEGLSVISWIIVFIPFILMTTIVSILLYTFGLDAATGQLNYKCDEPTNQTNNQNVNKNISTDSLGNIIIYDPEYNSSVNPVYYQSPNIIVPNPTANDNSKQTAPTGSSSPAYYS